MVYAKPISVPITQPPTQGEKKPVPPPPPQPTIPLKNEEGGQGDGVIGGQGEGEIIEDDTAEEDAEIVKDDEEDEGLITPNPLLQEEDKKPQNQKLEPLDPYEVEEQEFEADNALPKTPQNPFDKPNIDVLIQKQFNNDMWRLMKGALPCLETSATCLQLLQQRAITQSPLLKELDARVQEANDKIEEAKASGRKIIKLSILTPALQYLLGPAPAAGQPQPGELG